MRIVVIGAGVVGFHLAEQLSAEGQDITVVDSNPDLVRRIDERMDVIAISGDASCPSVLQRAGIGEADLAIAVEGSVLSGADEGSGRDSPDFIWELLRERLEEMLAGTTVAALCQEAARRGVQRAESEPAMYDI